MTSVSGSSAPDLRRGRDAVHHRHQHVHQHDVGLQFVRQPHRLGAVGGLADDLHIRVVRQKHAQALAHDLVVVGDQDADRHRQASGPGAVAWPVLWVPIYVAAHQYRRRRRRHCRRTRNGRSPVWGRREHHPQVRRRTRPPRDSRPGAAARYWQRDEHNSTLPGRRRAARAAGPSHAARDGARLRGRRRGRRRPRAPSSGVQAASPDVVLMDIELPGEDGIAATASSTATRPSCAVVMVSMQDDPATRARGPRRRRRRLRRQARDRLRADARHPLRRCEAPPTAHRIGESANVTSTPPTTRASIRQEKT